MRKLSALFLFVFFSGMAYGQKPPASRQDIYFLPPDSSQYSLALKLALKDDDRFFRLGQLFSYRQLPGESHPLLQNLSTGQRSSLMYIGNGSVIVPVPRMKDPFILGRWIDSLALTVHGNYRAALNEGLNKHFSADSLRELLWLNTLLNISNDSLVNGWLANIPENRERDTAVLGSLILAAPSLESKANSLLRSQPDEFTILFSRLPIAVRSYINGRIVEHSMQLAASRRDERFGSYVAAFARSTQLPSESERVYKQQMLHYYELAGDSERFTKYANEYVSRYLKGKGVDNAWTLVRFARSLAKLNPAAEEMRKEWLKLALEAYPQLSGLI